MHERFDHRARPAFGADDQLSRLVDAGPNRSNSRWRASLTNRGNGIDRGTPARTRRGCIRSPGGESWGNARQFRHGFVRRLMDGGGSARPDLAASAASKRFADRMSSRAVAQHRTRLNHMIDRLAVPDRARSGRVVADHSAHVGAAAGGHVGTELQAVFRGRGIERSSTTPGCTRAVCGTGIDLECS